MLPFIIGALALGAGAIIKAIADEPGSSNNSSYTTSDEDEQTYDALQEEEENVERDAWDTFSKQLTRQKKSLKSEAKDLGVGKVSLKGESSARISGTQSFSTRIGRNPATGGIMGFSYLLGDIDKVSECPIFSFKQSPLGGEHGKKIEKKNQMLEQIDSLMLEQLGGTLWETKALIVAGRLTDIQRKNLISICPKEKVEELESFISEANELRPRLVAAGILKAGKSTMMNCLIGDFKNNRFKTGVIRETIAEQIYEQDGYLFVDTPGIDANDQDSQVAEETLRRADVILFTHNMNGGGLDEPERLFLKLIYKNWDNAQEFLDKSVFVLTHLDKKESDKKMVESKVKKQVQEIFSAQPSVVSISSSRYLKGMLENKPILVKQSNYAHLNKIIGEKTKNVSQQKKKRYHGRIEEKAKDLKKILLVTREQLEKEIDQLESVHRANYTEFRKKVKNANANIAKAYALYLAKTR